MVRAIRRALAATAITASLVTMSAPPAVAAPPDELLCVDVYYVFPNGVVIAWTICFPV